MGSTNQRYTLLLEGTSNHTVDLEGGGKRFYKQIVKFGSWVSKYDPDAKMKLDKTWGQKIVDNFTRKVIPRVPVPLSHTDLPEYNTGEVVGVDLEKDGLYATLDIRDASAAQKIEDDLIWDVSISFSNEYVDPKSGDDVGPVLFHVALVNDPYLKGMKPFEALARKMNAIMLSESKETPMTLVKIKNDRDFSVTVSFKDGDTDKEVVLAPGEEVDVAEDVSKDVAKQVSEAEAPSKTESDDEAKEAAEKEAAEKEAAEKKAAAEEASKNEDELSRVKRERDEALSQLSTSKATDIYKTLLADGKIVPAQEAAFIALHTAPVGQIQLSDGSTKSSADLLTELFAAAPKRISFDEKGGDGAKEQTPYEKLSDSEKAGLKATGVSAEDYNKYGADEDINDNGSSNDDDEE
jgi:hypothetical protein